MKMPILKSSLILIMVIIIFAAIPFAISGFAFGSDMKDPRVPITAMMANQVIECNFTAEVKKIEPLDEQLPDKSKLKGILIDANPKWKITLQISEHNEKIPFSPGLRYCYIADVEKVFGTSPGKVKGMYEFSVTWNYRVPGKPDFENFKAKTLTPSVMPVIADATNPVGLEEVKVWEEVRLLAIGSKERTDANPLVDALAKKQSDSVKCLIEILQDETNANMKRIVAVRMLRILRAPEAVEPLIKWITLFPDIIDERTPEIVSPCVYALINIGKPAATAAIDHLTKENDEYRRKLLCEVLLKVEGNKTALFLLDEKKKGTGNPDAKANLNLARDIINERTAIETK